jgi:tetratricopeptide (TPR) repeat protein
LVVDVVNARAIAGLCRRLDGLPLAIELAAARTTVLDPQELNTRLARSLDVLGGGPRDAPDRQRTLRATIDWSYRLLSPPEAEAFARFAVFAGGATIEAAQAVTGAGLDALQGLVDNQLLLRRHGPSTDTRLQMLETVREYARERLDADEDGAETHRRHCLEFLTLAERVEPELHTRGEAQWLPRLEVEIDNVRAALDWGLRYDPTRALRLAGLLVRYWEIRGRSAEGLDWVEAALEAAGDDAPIRDRARARWGQVRLLVDQGAAYDAQGLQEQARAHGVEALALAREAADRAVIAEALLALAGIEMAASHPQRRRRELAEEALIYARDVGDDRLVASALFELALSLPAEQADAELEEAAAALRQISSSRVLTILYSNASYNAIKAGRPKRARPLLDRALPLARDLDEPLTLALVYGNVGLEALFIDDLDRAQDAFDKQLRLCSEQVVPHFAGEPLGGLAAIAARRGDPERAARLLGAATATGPVGDADVNAQLEEHFFEAARARHGPQGWRRAYAAGAEMSFDEAVGFALSPRPTPS